MLIVRMPVHPLRALSLASTTGGAMATKTAKPFKYRGKWRAQLTLENAVRVTRDFPLGQHDEAVRWISEQRANADSVHEPELGGPTRATLAQALTLYAHLFTIGKAGATAELSRINHYLEGAGVSPLQLVQEGSSKRLESKTGRPLPSAFYAHRDQRMQKRQQTYALIANLARKHCSRVSATDIRTLKTTMAQEGLSPSTIQKEIALLKHMFNIAIREWQWKGLENPCQGIKLGGSEIRFVVLSRSEREQLFQALAQCENPYFWPLIKTALLTSLRRSSLLLLRWENVDFENRVARVGSKTGMVTFVLSQPLIEVLTHMPRRQPTGPVFAMSNEAVNMAWERVRTKIGRQDLQFRDLRHIAATDLAKKGASSEFLRRFLQHKTAHMANIYINLTQHDMREQLDALQSDIVAHEHPPETGRSAAEIRLRNRAIRVIDGRSKAAASEEPHQCASDSGTCADSTQLPTLGTTHQPEISANVPGRGRAARTAGDVAASSDTTGRVIRVEFGKGPDRANPG